MSLLDANADELLLGATNTPPVAPKKQEPKFSAWSMFKAAPKGLAAGAAEGAGSTADILGAFGSVMGATDARSGMFTPQTPQQKAETNKAQQDLLANGPDYMSEAGRSFRNVAADYMPDAQTAHGAEVVVGDLFRMGGKALTAGMTLGVLPGALVAGAEEGFTASDKLAQQGVDAATRTKVGLVTAGVTAAGFAMPVAGKTIAQTVGLALAGGPLSYIGQQAATREILKNADYSQLADQYDPFDPVGLSLSTLLPLGFGAAAMRGAKVKTHVSAPEHVDAAHVSLLRENMDNANPLPDNPATVDAHVQAYEKAINQQAAGERVTVDIPEAMAVKASETMAPRLEEVRAEVERLTAIPEKQPMPEITVKPVEPVKESAPVDTANLLQKAVTDGINNAELKAVVADVANTVKNVTDMVSNIAEAKTAKPEPSPSESRIANIEQNNPKALDETRIAVSFDDKGKVTEHVSAREFLAEIQRQADTDMQDSKLLEVAANCFLSG